MSSTWLCLTGIADVNVYKTLLLAFVLHLALTACQNETGAPPAASVGAAPSDMSGTTVNPDTIYYGGKVTTHPPVRHLRSMPLHVAGRGQESSQ